MGEPLLIAIPAAGASRRLGRPKQLVEMAGGEPLLHRQCRIALDSAVGPVAVVLGCHAEVCADALAGLPVTIVPNEAWREGFASSLRAAARVAAERGAAGLLVLHGDQFRVTADDLRALRAAWAAAGGGIACRARHADYAGPPAILPAASFPEILRLRGDQGARTALSPRGGLPPVDVPMQTAVYDLDHPEDLLRLGDQPDTFAVDARR